MRRLLIKVRTDELYSEAEQLFRMSAMLDETAGIVSGAANRLRDESIGLDGVLNSMPGILRKMTREIDGLAMLGAALSAIADEYKQAESGNSQLESPAESLFRIAELRVPGIDIRTEPIKITVFNRVFDHFIHSLLRQEGKGDKV